MIRGASVAIAIITKNRHDIVSKAVEMHKAFSNYDKLLVIDDNSALLSTYGLNTDNEELYYSHFWLGVAGARNKALELLDSYDYIFLMDDDIFPQKEGWVEKYIDASMYLDDKKILQAIPIPWANIIYTTADNTINNVNRSTATLLMFTQPILETMGGFDASLGKYGHEDADFFHRARQADMMPESGFYTIADCADYLHICDICGDFEDLIWGKTSALGNDKFALIEESRRNLTEKIATGNPIYKPYK